jgi:hypothetical protein
MQVLYKFPNIRNNDLQAITEGGEKGEVYALSVSKRNFMTDLSMRQ